MRFRAVLFDLDGTLLDSLADIADACNRTLAARGFPEHPRDAYRYFVGDGVRQLMVRALPPEARSAPVVAECMAAYAADYARSWNATTHPYPGVVELLEALRARGLQLAVLSNKPHAFTVDCVAELLAGQRFELVLGASERFPHKPDPRSALHVARTLALPPESFLYLGDTATDMQTAVAAGMFPLGALWGFRNADELVSAGAQALLASPGDLLSHLAT